MKNPYYLDPIGDCGPCLTKRVVADATGKSKSLMQNYLHELTPFIIKAG